MRHDKTLAGSSDYLTAQTRHHGQMKWEYGYHRVFDLVSHFHPTQAPHTLRVLSIGPRTEIEFYNLWLFFGFSWGNIFGADLVSTSPKIACADISAKLPFEDNAFDVIVSSHCLEKSADPKKTRDEIRRVARPGAKVLIGGDRAAPGTAAQTPVNFFEGGVYGLIDLYGLRAQDIEYFDARSPHGYEIIFKVEK